MWGGHFGIHVECAEYSKMTAFSLKTRRQWTKFMSMFNTATSYMLYVTIKPSGVVLSETYIVSLAIVCTIAHACICNSQQRC